MGVGIAHAFLLAGAHVTVLERDTDAAAGALASLKVALQKSVDRGTVNESANALFERAMVATEAAGVEQCGLVVEAIPEILEVKTEMLARIEGLLGESAWLCSNTSSLSIDLLAASLARPERFCGLHFFNPVPSSTLVEIVASTATSPELVDEARGWVAAVNKTPIVVRDSPGFASSRLGVVIAIEAMRMLEEGVATAEDIDTAMVLGYKFPVGPLRLTDMVGLDVRLGISEYLASQLGERFEPPAILREKVAAGQLGRKSGRGFFEWSD
jgi:3-hydroxybutyryl-CoA dehydrogenase